MSKLLIEALENEIIKEGNGSSKKKMLKKEYEKALEEAGFDLSRIFKTKDGRYKTKSPKQICKTHYFDVLKSLYDYYYGDKELTFEECYQKWLVTYANRVDCDGRSYGTYSRYISDYRRFIEGTRFEKKVITKMKASDIHNFCESIPGSGEEYSVQTIKNLKTITNYVFDWAVNNDIVPYNVSRQVNLKDLNFRDEDNYEEIYSDEERKKLLKVVLNHPEDVIARMFVILFCMPLRLGEVRSIKWSDVDFENHTVYIHREVVKNKKTTEKFRKTICKNHTKGKRKKCNRYIPLSKTAEDLFRREYELRTNANEDSFVFSFTNGLNPVSESPVYRHLHKFCDEADITYRTPHKMRFWAVTKMYEAGVDQARIQYTAGHACPSTTDHYKRPSRLGLITTMKINEIFN